MNSLRLHPDQPEYRVIGYNYAEDHDNKIHRDDVAAQYGFQGGLVPGVGVYAYLTHPVVEAFDREWLERGALTVKFLKPVYHGEEVCVRSQVISPDTLSLALFNPAGILCAVGEASLLDVPAPLNSADYPNCPLPEAAHRPTATIANLPVGTALGSLEWQLDLTTLATKFLTEMRATLPLYFGAEAVCHPAFYLAQANEILMANVQLGPWIHTGSEVQHYALPRDGERLSLRGTVAASWTQRGHEMVTLDLGLFAANAQPIVRIRHSAILRLRAA